MTADDLSADALAAALAGRPFRSYRAVLSTEADALAWARADAPAGAVVVAPVQASPRGRAGIPWRLDHERDLAFSLVLRPRLATEREGWLYIVASVGLAEALGGDCSFEWPDRIRQEAAGRGAVGVQAGIAARGLEWAVVSVAAYDAPRPRARAVATIAGGIEATLGRSPADLAAGYARRCATIGEHVRVRVTGGGPTRGAIEGRAAGVLADGALRIETGDGRRAAVRPQYLRTLDRISES